MSAFFTDINFSFIMKKAYIYLISKQYIKDYLKMEEECLH